MSATCREVRLGFTESSKAAIPDTNGVANEVPSFSNIP